MHVSKEAARGQVRSSVNLACDLALCLPSGGASPVSSGGLLFAAAGPQPAEAARSVGPATGLAGGDGTKPPHVLRGLDCQSEGFIVGVGWLTFSARASWRECVEAVREGLEEESYGWAATEDELAVGSRGKVRGYERCVTVPVQGGKVFVNFDESDRAKKLHRDKACVVIPQSCLEWRSAAELQRLFRRVQELQEFRPTRLDCYFDDIRRVFSLREIEAAAEGGAVVGFRTGRDRRDWLFGGGSVSLTGTGWSFGRRGSDGSGKYVRAYDKSLESKDESGFSLYEGIRWEAELSDEKALSAFLCLMGVPEERFFDTVGRLVTTQIGFKDRSSGDAHLDRLPWWGGWGKIVEWFRDGGQVGRVKRALKPYNLDAALRRVARSLAMVAGAFEVNADVKGLIGWLTAALRLGQGKLGFDEYEQVQLTASLGLASRAPGSWLPGGGCPGADPCLREVLAELRGALLVPV